MHHLVVSFENFVHPYLCFYTLKFLLGKKHQLTKYLKIKFAVISAGLFPGIHDIKIITVKFQESFAKIFTQLIFFANISVFMFSFLLFKREIEGDFLHSLIEAGDRDCVAIRTCHCEHYDFTHCASGVEGLRRHFVPPRNDGVYAYKNELIHEQATSCCNSFRRYLSDIHQYS